MCWDRSILSIVELKVEEICSNRSLAIRTAALDIPLSVWTDQQVCLSETESANKEDSLLLGETDVCFRGEILFYSVALFLTILFHQLEFYPPQMPIKGDSYHNLVQKMLNCCQYSNLWWNVLIFRFSWTHPELQCFIRSRVSQQHIHSTDYTFCYPVRTEWQDKVFLVVKNSRIRQAPE